MSVTGLEIGLCWGTLINAGLPELIEAAARHGFPTLSVRPDSVLKLLQDMSEATLRRHLRDAGVRVRVIDALTAGLPGMAERAETGIRGLGVAPADAATCFTAAAVECPMVNVAMYGGEPVATGLLAEAIGGICRDAARSGLEIVLEFIPDSPMPDIRAARRIVETCGEANCRILLDAWHLARSGGSVADVAALPPGMLGAFQLDDRSPPEPGAAYVPMTGRKLPGEGQLPLHELTAAALANNPRITAELEVFSDELKAMPTAAAAARVAAAVAVWRGGSAQV